MWTVPRQHFGTLVVALDRIVQSDDFRVVSDQILSIKARFLAEFGVSMETAENAWMAMLRN